MLTKVVVDWCCQNALLFISLGEEEQATWDIKKMLIEARVTEIRADTCWRTDVTAVD